MTLKNFLLISILLFSFYHLTGQNLTCDDFKDGTFFIETVGMQEGYRNKIVRKDNKQIEFGYDDEVVYARLIWMDDCSYVMLTDTDNQEPTEFDKLIDENGGILVRMLYPEGDCYYFSATFSLEEGEQQQVDGKICKEEV